MKSIKLKINSFKLGAGNRLEFQNDDDLFYTSANNLVNLIPRNNNILTRRPGSNFVNFINIKEPEYSKIITINFYQEIYFVVFTKNKISIYKDAVLSIQQASIVKSIYELDAPYNSKKIIENITYVQDNINNNIIIFSDSIRPYILSKKYSIDEFELLPLEFIDGPYEDINVTDITLKPERTMGNNVNITASAALFSETDIGLHLRIYDEQTKIWGWGIITKVITKTSIKINIKQDFGNTEATKYWRKGVFNSFKGYPTLGKILNYRLYLATTNFNASHIWASCYKDYYNFSPTTHNNKANLHNDFPDNILYTNAITFAVSEVNVIVGLEIAFCYLVIGSTEGIFVLMPLDVNKNLSPFNFTIHKITNNGTIKLLAGSDNHIFFLNQDNLLCVVEFTYTLNTISSVNYNLLPIKIVYNILPLNTVNHDNTIIDLIINRSIENIVTVLFSSGEIAFITINTVNKEFIYSFSEVKLGGNKPKIQSIVGRNQKLFLLVERTRGNNNILNLEYIDWQDLDQTLRKESSLNEVQYLDCKSKKQFLVPTTLVNIPNNECIAIIADNLYIGEFISKDGKANLDIPVSNIIYGYKYSSYYESPDFNTITCGAGTYKKIVSLTLGFITSLGGSLKVNSQLYNNDLITLQGISVQNNSVTGYKTYNINYSYQDTLKISISQNLPLPLNINFLSIELLYS